MNHSRLRLLFLSSLIALSTSNAKASWDFWAVDYSGDSTIGNRIYTVNSTTGDRTLRSTRLFESNSWQPSNSYADTKTGDLVIYNGNNGIERYNVETNTWSLTGVGWVGNYQKVFERPTTFGNSDGTTTVGQGQSIIKLEALGKGVSTGEGVNLIKAKDDGSFAIGASSNGVSIDIDGINVAGKPVINVKNGNEIHIGENSFITRERDGKQEIYAQDAHGNAIPLNVTNGSDLQINGRSVQGQINNLQTNIDNLGIGVASATALTAALTALPATSDDSPASCGVGSGGYSGKYAMGFGCAAKVTERLAFNAGGSIVFGGASNYGGGTLDNALGRLGFVFKIGNINPTSNQAISKKMEILESQLSEVKKEKQQLGETLSEMKALVVAQNERLLSLEKIAVNGEIKSVSNTNVAKATIAQRLK